MTCIKDNKYPGEDNQKKIDLGQIINLSKVSLTTQQ